MSLLLQGQQVDMVGKAGLNFVPKLLAHPSSFFVSQSTILQIKYHFAERGETAIGTAVAYLLATHSYFQKLK